MAVELQHIKEVMAEADCLFTEADVEAALQLLPELNDDAESAAEMLGAELRALETLASELAAWEVPDPPQQPQLA